MSEIVYNDDPTSPDYCPNPTTVFADALDVLAQATKKAICDGDAAQQAYTDTQVASLQTQIDAVSNIPDLTDQLAALSALVNTLDLDSDGAVVNDLLAIKSVAEAAQAAASQAQTDASAASAAAAQVATDLASTVTSFNNSISTLTTSINNVSSDVSALSTRVDTAEAGIASNLTEINNIKTDIAGHNSRITALEGTEFGVPIEVVNEQICENNKSIKTAVDAAALAAKAVLEGACPVDDGGEGAGAGSF